MTAEVSPSVAAVVPNYNGWRDTVECVESLRAMAYPVRVVVVDNGSTDDSLARLREAFAGWDGVEFVEVRENRGPSGGLNAGIDHLKSDPPDLVWFNNNDVFFDPHCLGALVSAVEAWPDGGVFAPKIYYAGEPDVIWSAGTVVNDVRGRAQHRGIDEKDGGRYDATEPVESATGCSLLAPWDVVERVGGWSEDYYLYWEDVDWVDRITATGRRCIFVGEARMWHKVSRSFGGDVPLQKRYEARSRLIFYWRRRRSHFPLVFFWTLAEVPLVLVRGRGSIAVAVTRGIVDFLLGRRGRIR